MGKIYLIIYIIILCLFGRGPQSEFILIRDFWLRWVFSDVNVCCSRLHQSWHQSYGDYSDPVDTNCDWSACVWWISLRVKTTWSKLKKDSVLCCVRWSVQNGAIVLIYWADTRDQPWNLMSRGEREPDRSSGCPVITFWLVEMRGWRSCLWIKPVEDKL